MTQVIPPKESEPRAGRTAAGDGFSVNTPPYVELKRETGVNRPPEPEPRSFEPVAPTRPGRIKTAFTSLAGFDPELLRQCSRHEQSMAWKLGLTLFVPFSLAFLGGAYTFWTLTHSTLAAAIAAPFWATIVLILDIAVMPNLVHEADDGSPRLAYNSLPSRAFARLRPSRSRSGGIPRGVARARIAMALILGSVVSHSLLLGIFHQRVSTAIEEARSGELDALHRKHQEQLASQPEPQPPTDADLTKPIALEDQARAADDAKENANSIDAEVAALRTQINAKRLMIAEEQLDGRHSGTGKGSCGPYCLALQQDLAELEAQIKQLESDHEQAIAAARGEIQKLGEIRSQAQGQIESERAKQSREYEVARAKWQAEQADLTAKFHERAALVRSESRSDMLFHTEALIEVARTHPAMWAVIGMLFLAFLCVDLMPLLIKWFRIPGSYDALVTMERTRHIEQLRAERRGGLGR